MELVSSKPSVRVGREHGRGKEHPWGVVSGLCLWFLFFPASWYSEVMLKFNESLMLK